MGQEHQNRPGAVHSGDETTPRARHDLAWIAVEGPELVSSACQNGIADSGGARDGATVGKSSGNSR